MKAGVEASSDATKNIKVPTKPSDLDKLPEVKIVRTKSTWLPCQLLCYKMNMEAAVGYGIHSFLYQNSMQLEIIIIIFRTKPDTKTKSFSLFSCLTASNEANGKKPLQFTNTGSFLQDEENEEAKQSQKEREMQLKQSQDPNDRLNVTSLSESAAPSNPIASTSNAIKATKSSLPVKKETGKKTELELKILDAQDKHPAQKKDIYKAIFDSSDDEDDADADPTVMTGDANENADINQVDGDMRHTQPAPNYQPLPDIAFIPKSAKELNILRNTSPPRGIFSGLLTKRPTDLVKPAPVAENEKSIVESAADSYGPTLPPTFKQISVFERSASTMRSDERRGSIASISTNSGSFYQVHVEEQWIEKSSTQESKYKKEKKVKKKDKKERKKDKHKSSHHRDKKKKSKRWIIIIISLRFNKS